MNPAQLLSFLALRRLLCRQSPALAHLNGRLNGNSHISVMDTDPPIRRDPLATAPELQRAFTLTWLTIDLALHADERESVQGPTRPLVDLLADGPLESWVVGVGDQQVQMRAELSAANKNGPLHRNVVDVDDLDRQFARMRSLPELDVIRELENYALGDLGNQFRHAGFPHLAEIIESSTEEEDSIVVSLFVSFIHLAVDQSAEPSFGDTGVGILPSITALQIRQEFDDRETSLAVPGVAQRFQLPQTFDIEARVRQGVSYCQRGDYDRAIVEFSLTLQNAPNNPMAYFHRGDAHRLKGDFERSLADYSTAIKLDPKHIASYLGRGTAYRLTGAIEKADADFSQAIFLDPKNVSARLSRGAILVLSNRDDEAIAEYSEALRLDPSHAWAYQNRADVYAGKGAHDLALADYGQALRLNPYFPLAYSNRGDVYRLKGELDQAVADYSEAIRLDQFNPRIYTNRGDAYRQKGQYEQALADFGEAIRLDSTNPSGYLNRGVTLQLAGEYDRAVADFDRAEQFDSANPTIYYQRALAYQQQSSFERALHDLGRTIELNPRDAVAYLCRGNIYAGMRNFPRAIEDYSEAIRLNPKSEQAYLDRGTVRAQASEFQGALEDCAAALRLNPNLVPALLVRGGCQHRLGHHGLAVEEYNEAIRINPRYAKAYNDRGATRSKMGQLEEAVRDFSKAIELKSDYVQAVSNRATAYQLMKRHDLALRDLTQAVTLDGKYSAAYCVQRSLTELSRNRFDLALADCVVALQLDPQNALAKSTKAEILRLREQNFELDLGGMEPEPISVEPPRPERRSTFIEQTETITDAAQRTRPAPTRPTFFAGPPPEVTEEVVLQMDDLVEDEAPEQFVATTPAAPRPASPTLQFAPRKASPTQIAARLETFQQEAVESSEPEIVLKGAGALPISTEMETPEQTDVEFPPDETDTTQKAAATAEAERLKRDWEHKQIEIADKARKLRETNEATAKKNKNRLTPEEAEEERIERRKKIKYYAIIGIGALVLGFWLWQGVLALIPPSRNPFKEITAEKLVAEYAKDKNRADERFALKPISVKGKVVTETGKEAKSGSRCYFATNGPGNLRIELQFGGESEMVLKPDIDYVIAGVPQKLKGGNTIVMARAGVMSAGK